MKDYSPYLPVNIDIHSNNVTPKDDDILCGRGVTCYQHIGNQNFRFILAVHLPKYTSPETTRKEKGIMIQNIVNDFSKEGRRFLKEGIGGWFVLSHKEARYKVGHALRDAASEMKKHIRRHEEKRKSKRTARSTMVNNRNSDRNSNVDDNDNECIRREESIGNASGQEIIDRYQETTIEGLDQSRNKSQISPIPIDSDDINDGDENSWFDVTFDGLSSTLLDDNLKNDSFVSKTLITMSSRPSENLEKVERHCEEVVARKA